MREISAMFPLYLRYTEVDEQSHFQTLFCQILKHQICDYRIPRLLFDIIAIKNKFVNHKLSKKKIPHPKKVLVIDLTSELNLHNATIFFGKDFNVIVYRKT